MLVTLTLNRIILHTVVHHSSTSTYTPNFIEIEVTFCGRTDGHLRPTLLGRLRRVDLKSKGFPYSLPNVGPGADPGVHAVSPEVTINHPPGGRLPLLSARHAVTFPAAEHHHSLARTKLYCLVTETHRCKQLAQSCYTAFAPSRI